MTDNELLVQMNNSLILLVIALVVIMMIGFLLVLFDKNRTHMRQLEYGYNALPPMWQDLIRALVLKGKEAVDYLDDATDKVVGGRLPVPQPPPMTQTTFSSQPLSEAEMALRLRNSIEARDETRT